MERRNNKCRSWSLMTLGALLGMGLFYLFPYLLGNLYNQSMYNRSPMEEYLWTNVYGDLMIKDALTELTVVSYSMDNQEARLYSKYMAQVEP
jgi:hypothetical protein